MDDIEKKALALVNEVRAEYGKCLATGEARFDGSDWDNAFRRAIEKLEAEKAARAADREQHEAFRQEVSDSLEHYLDQWRHSTPSREVFACQFGSFILPKPVDPLVEAWIEATGNTVGMEPLNEAIKKRGGKIVWGEG